MYFSVIDARQIGEFKLMLAFRNGKTGTVDLAEYLKSGEIFQKINSTEEFKKFSVEFGTITWADGEIDIAPETIYEMATGDKIVFGTERGQKAG